MIRLTNPCLEISDFLSILRPGAGRRQFEQAVARKAGAQYGLAFNYGHAGFYALLRALNLTQDEIILPAYTCRIMPDVVVATGNTPVFVDIDLDDYNMDLAALRPAINDRTKVIVATHMFGYPTNIKRVRELAASEQILVVEDAAHTFPGTTLGPDGLQGDVALFSFGPHKPLFTLRGGVIVTNRADLYEQIRSYRDTEMDQLPPKEMAKRWALLLYHVLHSKDTIRGLARRMKLSRNTLSSLAGRLSPAEGNHPSPAFSLPGDYATRYSDLQARLGLTQLRKADFLLARRRAIAGRYDQLLHLIPGLTPPPIREGACYWRYSVRVKARNQIRFVQEMRARGIEADRTYSYSVPALGKYQPYAQGPFPGAEQAAREVVNLPLHADLAENDIQYIADSIRQVLEPPTRK